MTVAASKSFTLQEFLKLPETKPASQYIDGKIIQKPMPKGRHRRLQSKLCAVINQVTEEQQIAYAFPELRCTFGEHSIVPDIAVFQWNHIPFTTNGEVPDNFELHPDWTVEILSPQKPNKVIGNILHCLRDGCKLGWLIDPNDRSVLVFLPSQQPEVLQGGVSEALPVEARLPILQGIELTLTANQVFGWLKMEA